MNHEQAFAERVRVNQQRLSSELGAAFDYIVCGSGTSGSVVAARLASDPNIRVLVLEAGGTDETDLVTNPNAWPRTLGTGLDWGFFAEANPNLNGRAIPFSMGKVLGGGSSINVLTWSRGHKADWDLYASESGDPSWGYQAVLDLYRGRIEAWAGTPDPDHRGVGGTVHVQPAADPHPFSVALLEGAESLGLKRFPNSNGEMMEAPGGCAFIDETVRDGKRQSIFRSYLYPFMDRPNLTVLTGALATRILFTGQRATGIEFLYDRRVVRAQAASEVILSLGAIHTPKLLMQSGIGDEAESKRVGIRLRQSLPGVGRNLCDHVSFGCVWENAGHPAPRVPRSQTSCFSRTKPSLEAPNFYLYSHGGPEFSPENASRFDAPKACWSFSVGLRPMSRGVIRLMGPDPRDPVAIDAGYLDDPQDLRDLVTAVEMARAIGNSSALRPFTGREVAPGPMSGGELEQFLRNGLGTHWHQSGTARMGRDAMSVVDGRLRVHGVAGLRVADASILPRVTTGNTMAPCVVIGERAAEAIRAGR
jgi:choline dehydrogenase